MTDDVASLRQMLNEVLEQQKATGEILRVISQSLTDTRPVFEMIAERAMRLCGALNGGVNIYDGGLVHVAAHVNLSRQFSDLASLEALEPLTLNGFARPVPAFRVLALKT